MRSLCLLLVLSLTVLALGPTASAQGAQSSPGQQPNQTTTEATQQPQAPGDGSAKGGDRIATLRKLADSLAERETDLAKARADASGSKDPAIQAKAAAKSKDLQTQIEKLRADFALFATGIDAKEFEQVAQSKFDVVEEITTVIKPLISGLKEATEEPRALEAQRQVIEQASRRRGIAARAKSNLQRLRGSTENEDLKKRIGELLRDWDLRLTDAQNREIIAKDQLRNMEANRTSLLESTSAGVSNFFRTRGLHILLALVAFFSVFLGLRLLARPVRRTATRRRGNNPTSIVTRIISVAFHSLVGLLAVTAAMLVFYAQGDWGLLGISLLFLLGLVWASKEALPRYIDQVQLLLNVGAVREGERILHQGIPWRVKRINMFTYLTNPAFPGCRVRVTINDLVAMRSRPVGDHESWFPSEVGDWVLLSDGSRGEVLEQSPEVVRLRRVGGLICSIQTPDYLAKSPERMTPKFGLSETFGLGYRHQGAATTVIPEQMEQAVRPALVAMLGEEAILDLSVAFKTAAASSLDFVVIGEFSSTVAERYAGIKRTIQAALVEASNTHGWEIPFQQITIHQAAAS